MAWIENNTGDKDINASTEELNITDEMFVEFCDEYQLYDLYDVD